MPNPLMSLASLLLAVFGIFSISLGDDDGLPSVDELQRNAEDLRKELPENGISEAEALLRKARIEAADRRANEAIERSMAADKKVMETIEQLQTRVHEMQKVLDSQGRDRDPALEERKRSLEEDIQGYLQEFDKDLAFGEDKYGNPGMVTACMILSLKRAGEFQQSTMDALRFFRDDADVANIGKHEFWRMVAVCLSEFTEEELSEYRNGKIAILPDSYAAASRMASAEKLFSDISETAWISIRFLTTQILKDFEGTKLKWKPVPLQVGYTSMLALVPVLGAILFFGKMFKDMQQNLEDKRKKKERKELKKKR